MAIQFVSSTVNTITTTNNTKAIIQLLNTLGFYKQQPRQPRSTSPLK